MRKCFDRMKCWATLAREVVAAEYPDHDLFCAFGIFNVSAAGQAPCMGSFVKRLAKVFKVDEGLLLAQLLDHRPLARRCVEVSGCSSREAWTQTVPTKKQADVRTRDVHPADALLPVLTR